MTAPGVRSPPRSSTSGHLPHRRGVERPNGSPMRAERPREVAFSFSPRAVAAALVLPEGSKVLPRHPVFGGRGGGEGDGEAVVGDLPPRLRRVARRVLARRQIVRQIDHEARVAAGRTLARPRSRRPRRSSRPGRSWARRRAADRPAKPAPMTSQSAVRSRSRVRTGVCRALRASQPDCRCRRAGGRSTRSVTGSSRRPSGRTRRSRSSSARCTGRARRPTCRARRSRTP